jgi:hypothetical protein
MAWGDEQLFAYFYITTGVTGIQLVSTPINPDYHPFAYFYMV